MCPLAEQVLCVIVLYADALLPILVGPLQCAPMCLCRDSSQIPEKVMAVINAAEVIFSKCEAMQAGNTLRLQICAGVHAGPAVATVVGVQRPKWVMFGEASGIAEALRKAAVPSSILVSSDVEKVLQVLLSSPGC